MGANVGGTEVSDGVSELSEAEKKAIVSNVREFAEREIGPRVAEYDREEKLPRDLLERMAELNFFGGVVPIDEGGLGLDFVTFAQVIEEMSKVDHVLATLVSLPSGLVGASLQRYGTPEQKEKWLRPLAEGQIFGAAGVTEPSSGSDVAAMTTTYKKDGSDFIINGAKAWISQLDVASFVLTFATSDRSLKHRGVTAFVIPADAPGLSFHPYKDKLGFRPLSTGDVVLDDVRVPADCVLGEEGRGFEVAMTAVERGRLGVAARSVGVTQACLDDSIAYAQEREAFGKPISDFQIVQSQMYASNVAMDSATKAIQIHGAAGTSGDYRVARLFRDAKVLQIVEGSNDLHRALIGEIEVGLRNDRAAAVV
jgi:alkylation response protein AidB-like acyl-CoA dehydrogenase